ncbi:MAG: hypothetical protein NT163_02690 [Chlorobiales bacterium]|nr:hypothetical protein [Chlorobiales bacterium]
MMKQHNNNIEAKVANTMKLLDEIKPLEVHHLFRVRLMQRIENEFGPGEHSKAGFKNHFDFKLAFMGLLIMVNLGAALLTVQQNNGKTTSSISELLDNLNDDYTTQEFAYYDSATAYPAEAVTTETRTP